MRVQGQPPGAPCPSKVFQMNAFKRLQDGYIRTCGSEQGEQACRHLVAQLTWQAAHQAAQPLRSAPTHYRVFVAQCTQQHLDHLRCV